MNQPAVFVAALALVQAGAVAAQNQSVSSPTIRDVADAPTEYRQDRLDDFWRRIESEGAPLIESLPEEGQSLVTFVYRGDPETNDVQFTSNLNAVHIDGITTDFGSLGTMHRLPATDLWFLSFRVGDDLRVAYRFSVSSEGAAEARRVLDPLNTNVFAAGTRWEESTVELSSAPARPWLTAPATGRAGYTEHRLESTALGGEQSFWVSWPDQCTAIPDQCNIFIAMDAVAFGRLLPTTTIVEYLTAAGTIAPTAVVVTNDLAGSNDENGYEPAASFLADELLPKLRQLYGATTDQSRIVLGGTSRRGLISAYVGWARPDAVGNVLSLSGSYYWHPPNHAEPEWLPRRYAAEARQPVKLYLAVGLLETVVTPRNAGHYMLGTNRHMRDVLNAKEYEYRYVEFNGIHSLYNWHDYVADGLGYLLNDNARVSAAESVPASGSHR